ncbi:putative amino acid permease yfna [Globisporangium polare]
MSTIGILGGVGPAAGILLHQTILQQTESSGVDQGHLNVCHLSRSADIASRADFLEAFTAQQQRQKQQQRSATPTATSSESGSSSDDDEKLPAIDHEVVVGAENPADGMARTYELLRQLDTPIVAGIPCITFHVKPIWDEFVRLIDARGGNAVKKDQVRCLNMLDETIRLIAQVAPTCHKIGVMSTIGTREARVFHDLLEPLGYQVVEVSEQTQLELQDTILNPQWGIKSNAPVVQPRCISNFQSYARQLVDDGAELIILGCTEIPFAFMGATSFDSVPLLDPLVALARALIREVDPLRLKPLQ